MTHIDISIIFIINLTSKLSVWNQRTKTLEFGSNLKSSIMFTIKFKALMLLRIIQYRITKSAWHFIYNSFSLFSLQLHWLQPGFLNLENINKHEGALCCSILSCPLLSIIVHSNVFAFDSWYPFATWIQILQISSLLKCPLAFISL